MQFLCPVELAEERPGNYYLPDTATVGTCHLILDLVKPASLPQRECIHNDYPSIKRYYTTLIDSCVTFLFPSGYITFGNLQMGKVSFMASDAANLSNGGGVRNDTGASVPIPDN